MFKIGHKHSKNWYIAMTSLERRKTQRENALRVNSGQYLLPQYGNKVNLGKKYTEEHKKKISCGVITNCSWRGKPLSKMRKKKISESCVGRVSPMKGKHHTEEAKEKIRQYQWNGGLNLESYPLGWNHTFKEQIRNRDGYKCQLCGCPQAECIRKLSVHHIDYNKKNINSDNLITLCTICHSKTNHNRQKWENILRIK